MRVGVLLRYKVWDPGHSKICFNVFVLSILVLHFGLSNLQFLQLVRAVKSCAKNFHLKTQNEVTSKRNDTQSYSFLQHTCKGHKLWRQTTYCLNSNASSLLIRYVTLTKFWDLPGPRFLICKREIVVNIIHDCCED